MITSLSECKFHRYCSCIVCGDTITIQNLASHHRKKHSSVIKSIEGTCKECGSYIYTKRYIFCGHSCSAKYNNKNRNFKSGPKKGSKFPHLCKPLYTKIKKCVICGKYHPRTGKTCSDKCYSAYQSIQVSGKTGGWRNFGGNGKKGIYQGHVYQSSWELAWLVYHLDNKIPFRRCEEFFTYKYDNKLRKYYPDFYLIDDAIYVEIKGFLSKKTEAKINSVISAGHRINIITKKEIASYLDYYNKRSSYNGNYL